jgi:hypothetical protein
MTQSLLITNTEFVRDAGILVDAAVGERVIGAVGVRVLGEVVGGVGAVGAKVVAVVGIVATGAIVRGANVVGATESAPELGVLLGLLGVETGATVKGATDERLCAEGGALVGARLRVWVGEAEGCCEGATDSSRLGKCAGTIEGL